MLNWYYFSLSGRNSCLNNSKVRLSSQTQIIAPNNPTRPKLLDPAATGKTMPTREREILGFAKLSNPRYSHHTSKPRCRATLPNPTSSRSATFNTLILHIPMLTKRIQNHIGQVLITRVPALLICRNYSGAPTITACTFKGPL